MNTPVSQKTLVAALALLGLSISPSWAAVTGRYVRLEIPEIPSFGSNEYGMSHMSEIEVHSGGKNVALQRIGICFLPPGTISSAWTRER